MVRWWLLGPISSFAFLFPLNLYANSTVIQAKKIIAGRIVSFGTVDKQWLNGNYGATLRLKFEGGKDFSLDHFRIAPFGLDRCTGRSGFQVAQWEQDKNNRVLATELSPSRCESSRLFGMWFNRIQRHKGKLVLWIHAPRRVVSATLTWHTLSGDVIPRITNFTIVPNQLLITNPTVVAKFAADAAVSKFECHVDAGAWADCTSPFTTPKLSNGWHTIEARAWSVGLKVGRAVGRTFYIQVPPPSVEITQVDPVQDPTYLNTKKISFKPALNWGKEAYVECRMDGADFKKCVSPVAFSKVSPGAHSAEFRLVKSSPCYWPCYPFSCRGNSKPSLTYGEVVKYEWTVNQDALTLQWTQVPAQSSNAESFAFGFSASRPAEKYTCTVDGGSAQDCQSGYTVSALMEGAHQIQVQAWDQGAVKATLDYHWVIDRTAPELAWSLLSPSVEITNQSSFSGQYTVNEPATMTCSLDGTVQDSCPNPFEFVNLGQGSHHLVVKAVDTAGNSSSLSHDWTIDLTAPSISLKLEYPVKSPSSATSATLSFSSNENVEFHCLINGVYDQVCTSPWNINSLSDGDMIVKVSAWDMAGNISYSEAVTWTIDTVPPAAPLVTRTPGSNPSQSRSFTFTMSSNEQGTFNCQLNDSEKEPCSSPYVVNGLMDGDHVLNITAVDMAGNESQPYTETWTVAATAHAAFDNISPLGNLVNSRTMHFGFSSDVPGTFECQQDQGAWGGCTSPADLIGLADGAHSFSVRALNANAEVGTAVDYSWVTDATQPILTLGPVVPSETQTAQDSIQIAFSASEPATFRCSLDGDDFVSCSSPISYQGLSSSNHVVKIAGTDAAGNNSSLLQYSWTVDLSVPDVTIISLNPSFSPTASSQLVVGFDAGVRAVKSFCALDGGTATQCSSPWTISGLASGVHNIDIYSQNQFGRTGAHATYSWRVDTTPLTISNVSVTQVTSNSALITWTTNLPASSVVQFGQNSAFDQTQTGTPNVTSHSVSLTGLATNVLYQARAVSVDKDGRSVTSSPVSFRTLRSVIVH